jgi:hypothetical protein
MTYGNTVQWPAAEGTYQVVTFHQEENQLEPDVLGHPCFMNNTRVVNGAPVNASDLAAFTDFYNAGNQNCATVQAQWHHRVPADISGTMFTGLSKETTLTVNAIFYVEIAPHLYDPTFGAYVFTSAVSAKYDPAAMRLYSDLARVMPPGVMQHMNPLGEFWNWLVGTVKKVAPAVMSAVGMIDHPVAQALSKVAALALEVGKLKSAFSSGSAPPAQSGSRSAPAKPAGKSRARAGPPQTLPRVSEV